MTGNFTHLLSPGKIGELTTRNRIVLPAMCNVFKPTGRNGVDLNRDYYEARAAGGAGLVITEITCVDYDGGRCFNEELRLDDDKYITGMVEIVEVIKKHGARAAIQLHHAGSAATEALIGRLPMSASAIERPGYGAVRAMSVTEIEDVVARFGRSAERARRAGFDGIEIQGAHRYLMAQFLSAHWNKRTDDYGGSLENRARLLLNVIRSIRQAVGRKFPVWCRLNGREFGLDDGISIEETQKVAVWAVEAGVDALNISANPPLSAPYHAYDLIGHSIPPYGPGCFVDMAAPVRQLAKVPVIVAGKINPELGEELLRKGTLDFVAMGRQLIADPDLPNKLMAGKREDVRPCISCNCCIDPNPGYDCTVNAAKGREREYVIVPAVQRKQVVVVGGGPAGMEAARVAALRGHNVTLYEESGKLGGALLYAAVVKPDYEKLAGWLTGQMGRLNVDVRLGQPFTPEVAAALKPDALILAAGATAVIPPIPGADRSNVVSMADMRGAGRGSPFRRSYWRRSLLSLGHAWMKSRRAGLAKFGMKFVDPFGKRVVVIGSGLMALEIADYLQEKGKDVTMLTAEGTFEGGERPMNLLMRYLHTRLQLKKTKMLTRIRFDEITSEGVVIDDGTGTRLIRADSVVLAAGSKSNDGLAKQLEGRIPEIHKVGDCLQPLGIREAVHDGARIGRLV